MYQRIFHDRRSGLIHLWDDRDGYDCFQYQPYAYKFDPKGQHRTINGLPVSRVTAWTKDNVEDGLIFEHDVDPVMRTLIDRYYMQDDVSTGHVTLFFDIEVSKQKKYSLPKDAANPITAISYYDNISQDYVCLLVNDHLESKDIGHVKLKVFSTERELLQYFIAEWEGINPSIVTGWNSAQFDIPYLFNRIKNVIGIPTARRLSPINIAYADNFKGEYSIKIAGVNCMDYMVLYKKFTYNEEPSYKLDAIARKELGKGKIEYSGSLDELYETDIEKFIDYNVRDVELIVDLDKKLDFIEIARGICHEGYVNYEQIDRSSVYEEGAVLAEIKRMGKVAFRTRSTYDGKAQGAYVKIPQPGLYSYMIDADQLSEYPMTQWTLNISPETKYGYIDRYDPEDFALDVDREWIIHRTFDGIPDFFDIDRSSIILQGIELRNFLTDNGYVVSATGVVYNTNELGIIPKIIQKWFTGRKKFSKMAEDYYNAGDMEKYNYYNRRQLIQKILLNTLYGVLLLRGWRFNDLLNGESTTQTAVHHIKFSEKCVNRWMNDQMETTGIDYVQYIDTDSLIFSIKPLMDKSGIDGANTDVAVPFILDVAKRIQDYLNSFFGVYANRYYNVTDYKWFIKQEMIAKRAMWGSMKKRYAMWIINEKGLVKDKLEVKGYDVVRSNFPKAFRSFMKQVIVDILHDKDADTLNLELQEFKVNYKKEPIDAIMLPTSVKEISKYKHGQKGTPIHVKSAQNYNALLNLLENQSVPPINDGDKILWTYLLPNPYNFDTIALTGDTDPDEIVDFVQRYIDKEALFDRSLMTKMQSIWDDLGWGRILLNVNDDYF